MSLLFCPEPWSDLPEVLKPCPCSSCIAHRRDGLVENKRRKFRLVASRKKDDRFFVSEETLRPSRSRSQQDDGVRPTSILRLSDELILNIFQLCRDLPTSICLALSCKRLCSIYQSAVDEAKRRDVTHLWAHAKHSKRRLLAQLADGWVPTDRVRICWACFRFRPYGQTARPYWQARFQELNAQCTKAKKFTCDQEAMCWLGYPIECPRRCNPWPSLEGHEGVSDLMVSNVHSRDERVRCPECVLWGFEIEMSGKIIEKRNQYWTTHGQHNHDTNAILDIVSLYQ